MLEPGCGDGNFMGHGTAGDAVHRRRAGFTFQAASPAPSTPDADIRIENFRDTKLPQGCIDAVIGNPPFADVKLDYHGQKLSLHDFFIAKSVDALKPGGVLALVTSHFTLDKQNGASGEVPGRAWRTSSAQSVCPPTPSSVKARRVVTDILFLKKRAPRRTGVTTPTRPGWRPSPLAIDGADIPINRYFLNHPEYGLWHTGAARTGSIPSSATASNPIGDLANQLAAAIRRPARFPLPPRQPSPAAKEPPVPAFTPAAASGASRHRGQLLHRRGQGHPLLGRWRSRAFRFGAIVSIEVRTVRHDMVWRCGKEVCIRHAQRKYRPLCDGEREGSSTISGERFKRGIAESKPAPLDWSEMP